MGRCQGALARTLNGDLRQRAPECEPSPVSQGKQEQRAFAFSPLSRSLASSLPPSNPVPSMKFIPLAFALVPTLGTSFPALSTLLALANRSSALAIPSSSYNYNDARLFEKHGLVKRQTSIPQLCQYVCEDIQVSVVSLHSLDRPPECFVLPLVQC